MNTAEVAKKLVELCSQGKFREAIEQLYAKDIVNVEPHNPAGGPRETKGIDAVRKAGQWWEENQTLHSAKVTGPFLTPEKFAVVFDLDVTHKPSGKRMTLSEVAAYTVMHGKIVHAEFMYRAQ